jgi:stage III sporulation protein AG
VEPVIKGVVVVSPGADDIKVVSDITNAVGVALNITSNRICVIKMK